MISSRFQVKLLLSCQGLKQAKTCIGLKISLVCSLQPRSLTLFPPRTQDRDKALGTRLCSLKLVLPFHVAFWESFGVAVRLKELFCSEKFVRVGNSPSVVNQTQSNCISIELNRTQSNTIELNGLSSIKFGNRTKSNSYKIFGQSN